jgi:hypothetical protein
MVEEMNQEQLNEYRLELLQQRIAVEADISRSLYRLVTLIEACIQNSPWAMQIMAQVYQNQQQEENRRKAR